MSTFRKVAFAAVLAFAALATMGASDVSAQQTPAQQFKDYSQTGWIMGYYGYVYCDYARALAINNGYPDSKTQYSLYYAKEYAAYSYSYGYYGWEYGYADWILQAADLANASRNYEKGMYDYLYKNAYPSNRNKLQPMMDALLYGYLYEEYAEAYYRAAYAAVAK